MKRSAVRYWLPILASGLAVAACGDSSSLVSGSDDGGGAPTMPDSGSAAAADVPCTVAEVLSQHCWTCHTDPPRNAAPMPLLTQEDFQRPSVSAPGETVWERVRARIHDADSPMPPPTASTLDAAELATLDAWLDGGAVARPAGETCDGVVMPPPPTNVGDLPCTPTHEFVAHADNRATEPFDVPVSASNLYQCFTFRSPFGREEQATAWAPVIDDSRVLHHWILYRTQTEQVDGGVGPCNMPLDSTFLMGWALAEVSK